MSAPTKCPKCSTPLVAAKGPWASTYAPLVCPSCKKVVPKQK